jgi:hypothetical protein
MTVDDEEGSTKNLEGGVGNETYLDYHQKGLKTVNEV